MSSPGRLSSTSLPSGRSSGLGTAVADESPTRQLRGLGAGYWTAALRWALGAGLLLALPTRLIPNDFFARITPTRPSDYVIWVLASILIGLTMAVPAGQRGVRQAAAGGVGTFLAVGCPTCNHVVVGVIGTSGALSWFAPLQPILGLSALGLLAYSFRRRLRASATDACPLGRG